MKRRILILVPIIVFALILTVYASVKMTTQTEPIEKLDKFDEMATKLSKQITDDAEYNITLMNYKYLEKGYKLNTGTLDYICDLIVSGYDGRDVIDAAYFWLDTSENISIIKSMCEWKSNESNYEGKFWEENAFNFVTKNKCGVLSDEDLEEYSKQGITVDEIMIANRLCRKGEYTIQEILDKYQNGLSMVEVAIEIDSKLYEKKKSGYNPNLPQNSTATKIEDSEIFISREIAKISGQQENTYYKSATKNVDLSIELESIDEKITEEIRKELKTGGYFRTSEKGAK